MFVRAGGPCRALDPTLPAVRRWVLEAGPGSLRMPAPQALRIASLPVQQREWNASVSSRTLRGQHGRSFPTMDEEPPRNLLHDGRRSRKLLHVDPDERKQPRKG